MCQFSSPLCCLILASFSHLPYSHQTTAPLVFFFNHQKRSTVCQFNNTHSTTLWKSTLCQFIPYLHLFFIHLCPLSIISLYAPLGFDSLFPITLYWFLLQLSTSTKRDYCSIQLTYWVPDRSLPIMSFCLRWKVKTHPSSAKPCHPVGRSPEL